MVEHPSRFSLTQWLAAELSDEQGQGIERHVKACESCRSEVETMRSHVAAYEERAEAHWSTLRARLETVAQTAKTASLRPSRHGLAWVLRWVATPMALATAAALVLWVVVPKSEPPQNTSITYKGDFAVRVVAQRRAGDQFAVTNGSKLIKGDALRFVINTSKGGYLSIVSVDAHQRLSNFYPQKSPQQQTRPFRIARQGEVVLPGSVILDQTLGVEHFIIVFSKQTFDRRPLQQKIGQLIKRGGPQGLTPATLAVEGAVEVVTVHKVAP